MMKWAIAIALMCGVGFSALQAVAAPPIIPVEERKFDHARHEQSAAAAGGARGKAECFDCHKMDAKSGLRKPGLEHANRCIKCHDNPKTCAAVQVNPGTPKNPARRCDICHLPTGTCKLPALPPKPTSDQFQARFAHGEHIGFKVAIEQECAKCHPQNAPANAPQTEAHALCVRCHNVAGGVSSKLLFNNCGGCHQAPKGKVSASGDPFRLGRFDHRKHHTDSKQASCTGCHDAKKMTAGDKDAVPRPSMSTCQAGCHDGTPGKAFSAVGTTCTKCHKSAGGVTAPQPKDQVFSHVKHIARNVKIDGACQNCHSIKDDGTSRVEAPNLGKNHMPCAASGCHQTEFMSRSVKICSVCHDSAMPWAKAIARMNETKQGGEFYENMNHASHLQRKGATNSACSDCHGDKLGGGKAPKDHEACGECHGKGPPAHPMTDCDKCHTRTAPIRAGSTEWSVASTFVHKSHATDPRSRKTTNCTECHGEIAKAKNLAEVSKPKMQTCDGCHNGKTSFKSTGFECSRCHTQAKQASTPAVQNEMVDRRPGVLIAAARNEP